MRWNGFRYLVKQGWHNMIANRVMTVAGVGVLTACLVITGIAALVSANVNSFVDYLGSQNEVEVFIKKDVDDARIEEIGKEINALPNIEKSIFISKEQALSEMCTWLGEYDNLLSNYGEDGGFENPMNVSYRINMKKLEELPATVEMLRRIDGIEEIRSPSDLSNVLLNMKRIVNYGGWGLVAVLAIVSVVVISNTIRLTVFARRKEINIMKFVGATNAFIRLPFFVEGMTVGAISALLSSLIVIGVYSFTLNYLASPSALWLMSIVSSSVLSLNEIVLPLVLGFLFFGIIIGGIGCTSSIRKHLKV